MRPASIVNFERVVLVSIALGILNAFLLRDQAAATAANQGFGPGFTLAVQAISIAIYLLLIWFISRKASSVAKWIYVVLGAIGIVFGVAGYRSTLGFGTLPALITAIQYLLVLASIWLLFRPDAKAWFADRGASPDPDVFR